MNNNRAFVSTDRRLALDALRAQGAAARAERAADREAARETARELRDAARVQAVADRHAARVEEGRALQARISGGETREQLMAATGYPRNRVVGLIADARKADKVQP